MRRDITITRKLAIVAMAVAVISQIGIVIRMMQDTGMSFFEYAQLSDFGLFLALWSFNPAWLAISVALFFGGGLVFFFSARR